MICIPANPNTSRGQQRVASLRPTEAPTGGACVTIYTVCEYEYILPICVCMEAYKYIIKTTVKHMTKTDKYITTDIYIYTHTVCYTYIYIERNVYVTFYEHVCVSILHVRSFRI